MKSIKIFKEDLKIDLSKFIDSRALICANSGGGKSYAVRKILEESSNKVMSIILDVEGEFRTLREKYDFLLIGEGGDVPLNMKSAKLLPSKIMSLDVPTIIDISDLKRNERIKYVKDFLESLMELPRKGGFWKPCIIVLDEAHLLAGQQEKQDSCSAVIDLMTRGRKRGYCGILCTQRISKLHKDAVAECNNYMIGRTGLDIDMKRAGEILGFTSKKDVLGLRDLEEGEFYVFGTAISKSVIKRNVAEVKTTHPKPGMDLSRDIIKPTKKIISMLSKLKDLPQEAEKKLKEVKDFKKEINSLKLKIRVLESSKTKPEVDQKSLERARERGYNQAEKDSKAIKLSYESKIRQLEKKIIEAGKVLGIAIAFKKVEYPHPRNIRTYPKKLKEEPKRFNTPMPVSIPRESNYIVDENKGPLRSGAMKILGWLVGAYPNSLTKQRIATLSGFSVKGGTFNTYLSELKRNRWIVGGKELVATEEGLNHTEPKEIPSGEELLNLWRGKFRAGAGRILLFLYESYPNEVSKEEIGENTGFEPSGGTFNTYLSELRRNGLIIVEGGDIKISEEFF